MTLVSAVAGRRITTLEGLGTPEKPDPLQAAFIAEQAAQCGYCTNGMIMAAKALLARTPRPTVEQMKQALAGNLCRCGTHTRILNAVLRAHGPMSPLLRHESARLVEGRRRPRRRLHVWRRSVGAGRSTPPSAADGAHRSIRKKSTASSSINADGSVTVYTSKVDVGTGMRIAIAQMAAEELGVDAARITVVDGDTARVRTRAAPAAARA